MIDCEGVSALRLQVMWWACGHEFPMSTIGCETGSMDPLHVDQAMSPSALGGPSPMLSNQAGNFFFYCKAELAIKPCRSSRSNTRGGFEKFHDTCKTGNKNTTKQTTTPQPNSPKHQQNKQEHGKCHWMVRQVVKKSETSEAAQRSHMLNSTRKHKVSLVLCR